jgi:hypothetical protein
MTGTDNFVRPQRVEMVSSSAMRIPSVASWSAVTPKRSPDGRLDRHKARRYIHAMFRIVTPKLQQQCRFKGGICVREFRN